MFLRHDPAAVARRIDRTLPDVRLIAILRNPIDRANSAWLHHVRRGRIPSRTRLVKLAKKRNHQIQRLGLIDGGLYAASLRPYMKRFGPRLLVLLHDDIKVDPARLYERALRHIGASPDFVPDALTEVVFSNRGPSKLSNDLTLAERRQLWKYFRDDVRRLQKMIGRNLSMWDPDWVPPSTVEEPVEVSDLSAS
jgi:hypothetical protein